MLNDEKIKKAVGWTLSFLSIFLIAKTVSEVRGWPTIGKDIPPQTTIMVSGKGEIVVKPDIATFSFGIQEESLVVSDAQNKVAKTETEVLSFLGKAGVSKDDIKVSGYNIYPRYDYVRSDPPLQSAGKQVLAAYVVSESVEVKVRQTGEAGKIIGSMGELGVNNISSLTFSVDRQDEVLAQAREKAIADSKVKAEKLAKDLGVSLARVVSFSENAQNPGPIYYAKAAGIGLSGADVATPELPSGTNKITSQVSVTYEIR